MDAGYIKITAKTAADTSDAFTMSGPGKIIANGLAGSEYVKLLEEYPDGTYSAAVDKDGIGVVLTVKQPSQNVEGYGSYKLYKTATAAEVAVAYIS